MLVLLGFIAPTPAGRPCSARTCARALRARIGYLPEKAETYRF